MSTVPNQPNEIVKLELSVGSIHTVLDAGEPVVVFRPAVEGIGLDYSSQLRKLRERSWASRRDIPTTGADGKTYQMVAVDVETFLMWLATVNERKVSDEVREVLVAYQKETAKAVRNYWTEGGAVNPAATAEQVTGLRVQLDEIERANRAKARLAAMGVAKQFGLVNDSYIEGMARMELARMNGEEPDIDPQDITITCDEYLTERGVAAKDLDSARTRLGKTVAALYRARYRKDPQKLSRPIHGVHRLVSVYTHRDLGLFDTAWAELARHYTLQPPLPPEADAA